MTTRVYYSTDGSAPTLANSQNSLAALLYACLVTGYGAKSGLGWTREYTGTGKAIFKPGTGSKGHVFRIDDDVSGGSYTYGNITLGTGASGIDTMINGTTTIHRMYKLGDATGLHWMLVGNEKGFWFGTKRNAGTNVWNFMYVGELVKAFPTAKPDQLPMVMMGNTSNEYDQDAGKWTTALATESKVVCLGGPDGNLSECTLGLSLDNYWFNTAAALNWPGPNNALAACGRSLFYGTWASAQAAVRVNGGMVVKGRLPGHLLNPFLENMEDVADYPEFTVTNGFKTSATYKAFRIKEESTGNTINPVLFLEISDTWEL